MEHIQQYGEMEIPPLILDLSESNLISSAGVESLIEAAKRMRKVGSDVKLCNLKGRVYNTLAIVTRIGPIFEIYNTCEEAIQSLGLEGRISNSDPSKKDLNS